MAPPLKGCRAQGQLNANLIVGKFSINVTMPCDDFAIVHSFIESPVSKNVTQGRSNSRCSILNRIPHAILTSSSLKLLFYWNLVFGCYTCARRSNNILVRRKRGNGRNSQLSIPDYPYKIPNLPVLEKNSIAPPNPTPVKEMVANTAKARQFVQPDN